MKIVLLLICAFLLSCGDKKKHPASITIKTGSDVSDVSSTKASDVVVLNCTCRYQIDFHPPKYNTNLRISATGNNKAEAMKKAQAICEDREFDFLEDISLSTDVFNCSE